MASVIVEPIIGSGNAYITPYASSKEGGELLSEFNLRAALNAAAQKEVEVDVPSVGKVKVNAAFTGAGKSNSVSLSLPKSSANVVVSAGMCVIKGYFIHLMQALNVPKTDVIPTSEMTGESVTKLVLLRVKFTSDSSSNAHNERLIPPVGNSYTGVELVFTPPVVVNERNKQVFENELFLGTITRTGDTFSYWENPFRNGVFASSQLFMDDSSTSWITPPDPGSGTAKSPIYGVVDRSVSENGLTEITSYLWLPYNSNLGKHIRCLTTNPEDAAGGGTPLGILVGYQDRREDGTPKMWKLTTNKDGASISVRVLQGGVKDEDTYVEETLTLPMATYNGRTKPEVPSSSLAGAQAGLLDPETLIRFDKLIETMPDLSQGTEYGPFLDIVERDNFLASGKFVAWDGESKRGDPGTDNMFFPGDYFWVLNDEVVVEGGKLNTTFGKVTGNADTTVYGTAVPSSSQIAIRFTKDAVVDKVKFSGTGKLKTTEGSTVEVTMSGSEIPLSFVNAPFNPDATLELNFSGQAVSFEASSDDVTLEVTDPDPQTLQATGSGSFMGTTDGVVHAVNAQVLRGTLSGTVNGSGEGKITGTLPAQTYDVSLEADSPIEVTALLKDTSAVAEVEIGKIDLSAAGNMTFSGDMNSFTQNVSARYVYGPVWDHTNNTWKIQDGKKVYGFSRQAVLRGFATPATYEYFGFVRPNDDNTFGGVLLDENNHLKLNSATLALLDDVGWVKDPATEVEITPSTVTMKTGIWYTADETVIRLSGGPWDASVGHTLKKLRGNIVLDISGSNLAEITEDNIPVILNCEDIDHLRIKAAPGNEYKINVTDCVLATDNFNSINQWVGSRFDSGSNTAELNNPWMTVSNPFEKLQFPHSLQTRFVSVTRGKDEIEDAVLDIWVKLEDADGLRLMDWSDPVVLQSKNELRFPPLYIVQDEAGNVTSETQYIPDTLGLKVSGTGGVHKVLDNGVPVLSGSFVSTIDWIDGSKFSLVGRLTNPDSKQLHGLYDIRFRAHVQFVHKDDAIETSISYAQAYPS